ACINALSPAERFVRIAGGDPIGRMSHPASYSRWRPHPGHGLEAGADAPRVVNAYVEITPFDLMKYEVDGGLPRGLQRTRRLARAASAHRIGRVVEGIEVQSRRRQSLAWQARAQRLDHRRRPGRVDFELFKP